MVKSPVLTALVGLILVSSLFLMSVANADWVMFHGDECNSGVGTGDISGPPRLIWNYTTTQSIGGCAYSPTLANGILYEFLGNSDDYLCALNASTGESLWNYTFSETCSWSPAIADGVLYTGSYDHYIYAIDALTGTLIWKYNMDPPSPNQMVICSSPTVSNGVVYAGYGQSGNIGALIAINASTGSKIWNYSVPGQVLTVPAIADGIVYAGTFGFAMIGETVDQQVFAVNATTGTLLWTFHESNITYTSSPAVVNGLVYIGSIGSYSMSNKIFALDAYTGVLVWSHEVLGQANSSPAVANNIVYIGSNNGSLYAFNALTGTQIWSYKTGGAIISSPAVSKGVVCVGSSDGFLYAFDANTGANIWKYATDGRISSSPAVSDGKIYFISDNSTSSFPSLSGYSTIYALYATPWIKSDLAVSCVSSTSYDSFHVTIKGTLTTNGTGSSAVPIQISYSNSGGATWQNLTQVLTDSTGEFTLDWLPSASGNYIINAAFNGNLTHSTVSTVVNLAVMPYQSANANFVFSVASNSTVTDLAFNSTSRILAFNVKGPSDTMGYTDICIPKALISDISTLTISVDNNQVAYTAVSEQDSWLIHFSYHHSTHLVTITLDSTQQNADSSPTPTSDTSSTPTTPTASPPPTSNPTTNPTASPTQNPITNPTASPSANPSPAIPEFPSTILIISLATAILLFVFVVKRKQTSGKL